MHKIKRSRNLGKTPDLTTSMQPHETPVKPVKIADFETNSGVVAFDGDLVEKGLGKVNAYKISRIVMNLCILRCIV